MATRALVIDGVYSKGAIWRNGDGFPKGMGGEILRFIKATGNFDIQKFYVEAQYENKTYFIDLDTQVTPKYLNQIENNNYRGNLYSNSMLDAEYKYVVMKDGLYVKGILTKTEEKQLYKSVTVNDLVHNKVFTYRKLFMKDGKLCFIDIDKTVHQVTI